MAIEEFPSADHVFDGGSMDCGSGLILLIRQNMLKVPEGGILEIRSSEPTVETELPPWCRMVGHVHLQSSQPEAELWRHWVQRGGDNQSELEELESDKTKAKEFKWSLRARRANSLETTVYSRNFSWPSGNSVDFDRSSERPSSVEQFFGSVLADVINCFSIRCSRSQIVLDELEGTVNGTLNDSLAATGIEQGDSSVRGIKIIVYVTSTATSEAIQREWQAALSDSAVFQTIRKACEFDTKLVLM
ncbi:MAG: hypothetical protein AAF483_07735 [Planctomycetota bacterium]